MKTRIITFIVLTVLFTASGCAGNKESQLNKLKLQQTRISEKIINLEKEIKSTSPDKLNPEEFKFVGLTEDNIVNVELMGACGSCPYSIITLKNGVETAMMKAIPEIKGVEAVNN